MRLWSTVERVLLAGRDVSNGTLLTRVEDIVGMASAGDLDLFVRFGRSDSFCRRDNSAVRGISVGVDHRRCSLGMRLARALLVASLLRWRRQFVANLLASSGYVQTTARDIRPAFLQ